MRSSAASGSSVRVVAARRIARTGYADLVVTSDNRAINQEGPPDYSEDGVDLTLIRWMLSLTPNQRLQFVEERINEILAIRELNARNQALFNPAKPL